MRLWTLLQLAGLKLLLTARAASLAKGGGKKWAAEGAAERAPDQPAPLGQPCMTVEHFRALPNASDSFLACAPLSEEERLEFALGAKYLGVWSVRRCPRAQTFDAARQRCVDERQLHRQQARCRAEPQAPACAVYCQPAVWAQPAAGVVCNWQFSLLYYTPEDTHGFLQCTQTSTNDPCGEWVRVDCPAGTAFDLGMQLCIPLHLEEPAQTCAASNQAAVCKCGRNSGTCPGISVCTNGVCCATVERVDLLFAESPVLLQAPATAVCMGSGAYPVASCSQSCPQSYTCQPNVGCCPLILSLVQTSTPVQITPRTVILQMPTCPLTNTPPVSSCGSCPAGFVCAPMLGACCPVLPTTTLPAPVPITQAVTPMLVALCPSGTLPTSTCSPTSPCPAGSSCVQGACCPCQCPPQQVIVGICAQGVVNQGANANCAASGGSCVNGCCCQAATPAPSLPTCSNGQQAVTVCISSQGCGQGMECSNGGCCPIPYCPTGQQAVGRCGGGGAACGAGTLCLEGLCCARPACPGGQPAASGCAPACAALLVALKPAAPACCAAGQQCVQGLCCPLPACPATGALALLACTAQTQCPPGTSCQQGACCPQPLCPGGQPALAQCAVGAACPIGTACSGGLCCQLPVCQVGGGVAQGFCRAAAACPAGFHCEYGACCPEPVPLCPTGGRSVHACLLGSDCPAGYGCTSDGGCCKLVTDFLCPLAEIPVCQCSPTMSCPGGTRCHSGMCCSPPAPRYHSRIPGVACESSSECAGFESLGVSAARCVNDVCVCVNGAYSNGAACLIQPSYVYDLARNGCDEYGSPCQYMFSQVRRRPVFSPVQNVTEKPLWYKSSVKRNCPRVLGDNVTDPDSTCLPSETCVAGECRMRLWPGEYGCQSNQECQSRCPNTYCEHRTEKDVPQCQCSRGLLLYSRCFDSCPKGFHESGARCEHDDEDVFWSDRDAQTQLQALLNEAAC